MEYAQVVQRVCQARSRFSGAQQALHTRKDLSYQAGRLGTGHF